METPIFHLGFGSNLDVADARPSCHDRKQGEKEYGKHDVRIRYDSVCEEKREAQRDKNLHGYQRTADVSRRELGIDDAAVRNIHEPFGSRPLHKHGHYQGPYHASAYDENCDHAHLNRKISPIITFLKLYHHISPRFNLASRLGVFISPEWDKHTICSGWLFADILLSSPRMKRITTSFGFRSTAAEVVQGIDLLGKRAVVTGGASGIGVETARALAGVGAEVTLAVRDVEAGARAAADIMATTHNSAVRVKKLDLLDRTSIGTFVAAWTGPLHILVNNAGIMACPEQRTPEGWEWQFATNHLGHFALAIGLHDALAAAGNARIVAVSSSAHMLSPVIFDDLHFAFRRYDPWLAYGQSKTANILFAVGATARWRPEGITANALNPGAIATNLQRHIGGKLATPLELQKTREQGAATSVFLAMSPLLEGIGGRYFSDCNEAEPVTHRQADYGGVAPYALDPSNAHRLWEMSVRSVSYASE